MLWSQTACASAMFLIGIGCLIYGTRSLAGQARTPWSYFLPKKPVPGHPPGPRETVVSGVIGITVGTIAVVGGIGLLIVSLI